jgi:lysophospholipase L1-like esterase
MRKYNILIVGILLNLATVSCGLLSSSNNNNGTGGTTSTTGGGSNGNNQMPTPSTSPVPDTTPYTGVPYRFVGRLIPGVSDANAPQTMSWGDSTVVARFTGTQITANLTRPAENNNSFFDVVVDGNVVATLDPTLSTYTASNLTANSPHEVRLKKRNEADYGTAQFTGFTLGVGGAFLQPQAALHRIEFIGDSISNGYGDLGGTNANCTGVFSNEDTTQAYGPETAAQLNADVMVSAWSGKGVIENNDTSTTELMPQIWLRSDPTDSNSAWTFTNYQPDVVVVNLGTNDFSNGIPDATQFTTAYGTFLQTIRSKYAQARIYVAIGPMLSGDTRTAAMTDLQAIVATAKSTLPNGSTISLIDFGTQMVDAEGNGAACDWHPTLATHLQMASQLATQIKKDMSW